MRNITIGRGRECDVRLEDSTDMVSRRQAVIKVSPMGKMEIFDTSANGTYVNGEKIEKPDGKPVKRGDNVNFAHVVDLDWSKVKDPYRPIKVTVVAVLASAVVAALLYFMLADKIAEMGKEPAPAPTVVIPQEDTIVPPPAQELPPVFDKGAIPDVSDHGKRNSSQRGSKGSSADLVKDAVSPQPAPKAEETPVVNDPSVDQHLHDK